MENDIVEIYPAYLNIEFRRKPKKARVIFVPKNRRYVLCEDEDGIKECFHLKPYNDFDEREIDGRHYFTGEKEMSNKERMILKKRKGKVRK